MVNPLSMVNFTRLALSPKRLSRSSQGMSQKPPPNRVREWRKLRGLSQEGLASLMETSWQQVSRLERSERRLTDEWLERLAAALQVSKAELLVEKPIVGAGEPRVGDSVKDEFEARMLRFWRRLRPEDQDVVRTFLNAWRLDTSTGPALIRFA